MVTVAYYNENDPFAAAWLRKLISAGLIAPGDVDERSIEDVRPDDLRGYAQCHFFAGIGGWSYALRLAGWPDDRPVWTGSCPCQPHSSAARGRNVAADLWPQWFRLIAACRPRDIFGEQVDEARAWLDGVCADVEGLAYTLRAAILPAYCVGEDHARERIYFACHADGESESSRPFNGEMAGLPRTCGDARNVVRPHGVSARVAIMRAFGNAIHPDVAATFIRANGR